MDKCAVVVFDEHLHEVSQVGTYPTLVVPDATSEQVMDILEANCVTIWNNWYITKSVRVLTEAGYKPIVLNSVVVVHPHDDPAVVYQGNPKDGIADEGIDTDDDTDPDDDIDREV